MITPEQFDALSFLNTARVEAKARRQECVNPGPCPTCGAPAHDPRRYPDGWHWTWTHLGYCRRGKLADLVTAPVDETDYLAAPHRYERGDFA